MDRPPDLPLPDGYVVEEELTRRPTCTVVRARRAGRPVVVRIERNGSGETAAELAVLARVDHAGIARLVDHGMAPGGRGHFLAREWVDGVELTDLRGNADSKRIGRIVARLCAGLQHLHELGFVHADLKSSNVILRAGDHPVLTDFGLARAARTEAEGTGVAGTYFAIAPEVLLGGVADSRADLFALGVLLHDLLVPLRVSPREFYGRFPARSFFEAAETRPSELPDWARDVVAALLDRDPDRRPASAALVGARLAGRLGERSRPGPFRPRLRFPVWKGREGFLAERFEELRTGRVTLQWWKPVAGEDADTLAEQATLVGTLDGVPLRHIELAEQLAGVGSSSELDGWARRAVDDSAGSMLFVSRVTEERWTDRALACLSRAAFQARARAAAQRVRIVVCAGGSVALVETGDTSWRRFEVPAVREAAIVEYLAEALERDPRADELGARLHAECSGSAAKLQRLLDDVASSGWIQFRRGKSRLRPGPLPSWMGRSVGRSRTGSLAGLPLAARRFLAGLSVLAGRARLGRVAALLGIDGAVLGEVVERLVDERRIALERNETGRLIVRLDGSSVAASLDVEEAEWCSLHANAARLLEREGAELRLRLPHLYRADPGDAVVRSIVEETERLRDRGGVELALDLFGQVEAADRSAGRDLSALLAGHLALTWASAGEADRALGMIEPLEEHPSAEVRAIAARARARVARERRQHREALAHYERALSLSNGNRGEVFVAKARLLFEMGCDEELEGLVDALSSRSEVRDSRIQATTLQGIAAMSAFRRGDVDGARAMARTSVEAARGLEDPLGEAVARINLGTIERRTGRLDEAVTHFERAESLFDDAGDSSRTAQARVLLGGTLREAGQPSRAEQPLIAALEVRERLGDDPGAALARGVVGLVLAERGELRSAIEELERSARDVRAVDRETEATLLEARVLEARARLGDVQDLADWVERARAQVDREPRIAVAVARAVWIGGDERAAERLLQRAFDAATRLGRTGPLEESAFLLTRLGAGVVSAGFTQPSTRDDARVLALSDPEAAVVPGAEALELAQDLAVRGRHDRAARLFAAVAARGADPERARIALAAARDCLDRCTAGLTESEVEHLRRALLGFPDPWPGDLDVIANPPDEDWDMDVISVLEINHRLVEQQDLSTLLGTIVENAIDVTGAERGFLVLEEHGEFSLDLAFDSRRGDIAEPEVEVSHSIVRRVLDAGAPMRLSDAAHDPVVGAAPSVSALELRSILCHPFEVEAGLRGVIYLDDRLREGAFTDRAEKLLSLLADQAALAIRQVRRLEEIRRLNAELNREVVEKASDLKAARRALVDAGLTVPSGGLVGHSAAILRAHELLHRLAQSQLPVLVCGASGTGKELAARALHDQSPWSAGPFVSENCAALPPTLIESELFGFRQGAFTGADRDQPGLFERAAGGTLFLDEIGELPLELQAKLLRILETREVRRLGDTEARAVEFRLVAATNRDLAGDCDEKRFRADLYYRLDGARVEMPALAERVEDIPDLVDHFLRIEEARSGARKICSPDVLRRLCDREWPGNVRELANEISRLCVLSAGDVIDPDLVRTPRLERGVESVGAAAVLPMAELERQAIEAALERTAGDKRRAADLLGISRAKIYQRLKEWSQADAGREA